MPRQGWPCSRWFAVLILVSVGMAAAAADPARQSNRGVALAPQIELPSRKPSPIEDDAQLHDIQFQGKNKGWAVGDHGVIWHTRDGGREWELQNSGVNCTLSSVCFLTDSVGWAAGGGTMPFTRLSYGVLLHTTDGGRTWKAIVGPAGRDVAKAEQAGEEKKGNQRNESDDADQRAEDAATESGSAKRPNLPRLTRVKFFSVQDGLVAGQGGDDQPSGVFVTDDGGASWKALPGQASPGWLAADFSNPESGVVAGPRGRVALVSGRQVVSPRVGTLGARGLRDIVLHGKRSGWLVGDGGLVLKTENAGLVWKPPAGALPDGIRDACDFHAVCCRGSHVWVAGEPGSVVFHSPDAGASWTRHTTGQTVPIAAMHFGSDECGAAVGALGTILRTDDGGRTWESVRGERRRMAVMFLKGSRSQVALQPIVALSAEDGYRSLISVVAGEEPAAGVAAATDYAARLNEAMMLAGGSATQVDWRFLLDIPGLDRDMDKLVAEWNRRTEGRLEEVLIGGLVRQLRTWRPSVLVLENAAQSDALTQLIDQAAHKAVQQAQDAARFVHHGTIAGLEPWRVEKVFAHLPPGSTGHVHIDPHQFLPRVQATVHDAAAPAASLLFDRTAGPASRDAYRLLHAQWDERRKPSLADSFFAGLSLSPGSDARRILAPIDDGELEARRKLANRQRDFAAITERSLNDPRQANQLIAQLPGIIRGMSDAQAALQLSELAERYHQHGQWELSEPTLVELVNRFPDQPAAHKAMQQLIQYWASGEITWRRLKNSASEQRKERNDPSSLADSIVQVEALLHEQLREVERTIFDVDVSSKPVVPAAPAASNPVRQGYRYHKHLEEKARTSQMRAVAMARKLEKQSAQLAATPEVQFPMAAVYRQRAAFARSDEIYRRLIQQDSKGLWAGAAEAEMWLNRPVAPLEGPMADCVRVAGRPLLDGVLSDECWQNAGEIPLKGVGGNGEPGREALAMMCHDEEYLYLAASLPRVPGVRTDGAARERRYDDDLTDFDRVTFFLDIDRDRVTYYSFSIDQRGCTADACWHDSSWNPQGWFVKVQGDEAHWRVEAAVPFAELTPQPPRRGEAWGVGVVRTVPAVGRQSWTLPASENPRPESFGLVRFD